MRYRNEDAQMTQGLCCGRCVPSIQSVGEGSANEDDYAVLGKHSTNIWLVHMFFYSGFLRGHVLATRYPVLMLASLLALCIVSSCAIMQIDGWVQFCITAIKQPLKTR